jgi:hypothetical protein
MISDDFTIQIDKGHFGFFLMNTKRAILDFWNRGFGLKNFYALVWINHKDLGAAYPFPNKP